MGVGAPKSPRRHCLFHGKLLGMFLYNKPLADPWFLFPPPLLFFLLQPCLSPSIQLPELAASWGSRGV